MEALGRAGPRCPATDVGVEGQRYGIRNGLTSLRDEMSKSPKTNQSSWKSLTESSGTSCSQGWSGAGNWWWSGPQSWKDSSCRRGRHGATMTKTRNDVNIRDVDACGQGWRLTHEGPRESERVICLEGPKWCCWRTGGWPDNSGRVLRPHRRDSIDKKLRELGRAPLQLAHQPGACAWIQATSAGARRLGPHDVKPPAAHAGAHARGLLPFVRWFGDHALTSICRGDRKRHHVLGNALATPAAAGPSN